MELQGKVIKAFPIKKGTSKSGKNWQLFEFVLEIQSGEYKNHASLQIFGEDNVKKLGKFCDPKSDKEIIVSFDVDAREYEGKWYNSLRVWKIKEVEEDAPQEITPTNSGNAEKSPTPTTDTETQPSTNSVEKEEEGDDLPF